MRVPSDLPKRSRRATRGRIIIITLVALFILLTSLRSIASFYTDYLWFKELKFTSVFRGVLVVQVLLAVFFCLLFFGLMLANLVISDRIAPRFRPAGPEDELVQRYREAVGPHANKVRVVVAVVFALFAGIGARSRWNDWVLFSHYTSFGVKDPQFGRDIGFFVFQLPFIKFFIDWLFVAIIITLVVTVVFHYLNGGIRVQSPVQRVTPQVKAHISVLLGALALVKAVGYWFERFELDLSTKHVVDGATYTSVHADLPAKTLLIVIAIIAAGLFIFNIYQKGWTLPIIAVGLWGLIWVLVGGIYPAVIQSLRVSPAENLREKPFIARNIAATRTAFQLNNVNPHDFVGNGALSVSDVSDNTTNLQTLQNIRLLDPAFVKTSFDKLQEIRSYYQFKDLDVDRYTLAGALTQTLTAVREIKPTDVGTGFVNQHLVYTHGYGATMAPANQTGVKISDGTPNFVVQDVPPQSSPGAPPLPPPPAGQPRIYYGESQGSYVIVGSDQPELDYQDPSGKNINSRYDGTGGVTMGSIFRRFAFALRFGDLNPVISGLVTSNSRIMYVRNISDRVRKAAPFLKYDNDPYSVILNGRIYWVQDAYTVTSRYPYSQQANADSRILPTSGLSGQFNYVRNSVKVVIDSYNGTMKFYVMDPRDPIVQTYEKAFPELFTPLDQMDRNTPGMRAHLRYPEDLFRVQTNMFGRYHLTDPDSFYTQANAWTISQDPGSGPLLPASNPTQTTNAAGVIVVSRKDRMQPTYQLTTLPTQTQQAFLILQPFVPVSPSDKQQNLTAFMTAKGDPSNYGSLDVYITPPGQQIDGPALINAAINSNPDISKEITLLNTNGSVVVLGNVITVPINTSLLYVQPLYVQAQNNPLPRLADVIVVYKSAAYHGGTLYSALCQTPFGQVFCGLPGGQVPPPSSNVNTGGSSGTTTGSTTTTSTPATSTTTPSAPTTVGPGAQTVPQLLADAQMHFQNADNALKANPPDLGMYQKEVAAAEADIAKAKALAGG